jgi:Domain of unknown function (DUF6249)
MNPQVFVLFIPITAIVMSLLIPIVYVIVDYRRRRDIVEAHHKERLAAIERGTDVPPLPESFYNPMYRLRRPRTLLTGMVWFFVGIALTVALGKVAGDDVMYFGLIPTGVGLAFLIYYAIEGRKEPGPVENARDIVPARPEA